MDRSAVQRFFVPGGRNRLHELAAPRLLPVITVGRF
jgi:hypothetical protein